MQKYTRKYITTVEKLQSICVESYLHTIAKLLDGMSEKDIENILMKYLKSKGITNSWYDIGIMVLVGEERFLDMTEKDYSGKSPSLDVRLNSGDPIFIDLHPMDNDGIWGDFSSMSIFKPSEKDRRKVTFLEQIYDIHISGINNLNPNFTGEQVYNWYKEKYQNNNIILNDSRNNVGHTMSKGSKLTEAGVDKRYYLDENNKQPISNSVIAIEPGGYKKLVNGQILIGRFEDCVYIPNTGKPQILGRELTMPIIVK